MGGGGLTTNGTVKTVKRDVEGYADISSVNRHPDIDTTTLHDRVLGAFE